MSFENVRDWQGTAKALIQELERKSRDLKLSLDSPNIRNVRAWRSKGVFSHEKGENFKFRQILEGLETLLLLKKGWTLNAIADILPSFDDMTLEQKILAESTVTDAISPQEIKSFPVSKNNLNDLAKDAVVLLAQGILQQYTRILDEIEIVRQDDRSVPATLHQAMYNLGRLYIEEELCDRAACIHDVLDRSRYTLHSDEWGLDVFKQSDFSFRDAVLIDPDLRVPTSECSEIARSSGGGFGEDNVIEYRLYKRLKENTERLGGKRKHLAYTALRELVGRYSLIEETKLIEYLIEHELTPLQGMLINDFFVEVPEVWLIKGLAHRCADCGTLMHPHPHFSEGYCPIRLCEGNSDPMVLEKLDPQKERLLIVKPQILTYWTAPAIDEINIFDRAREYGLDAQLYPESDLCDVSINNYAIGIDAKSYNSPISLAMRLNRTIGGLIHYRRRIIAASDRIVKNTDGYLDILRSSLDKKGDPVSLEIKSVSEVLDLLKEVKNAN
ncbi:hypothetical protein [Spirulina sp. 06S082]|uniref:restriction endonuclease-related protein n=1 Tax=Spirulina sp. 06S082 TaxID=3110248 RepID=UPI002B1FB531|nr:hypothetical protein [Spirulina sp. 06S082]MEA5472436.1 hypothetical protein [Spirulina sp. 06S082]